MEKHEVDMVIAILEMFKMNAQQDKDNTTRLLMLAMENNQKEKEYVQKVPEVNAYERSMAE